jgi:pyridinium-3,5-biscarboxylic acid mononucleotide sulfurtransferase
MDSFPDAWVLKESDLIERLTGLESVVVAFSGGVDSSYLAEMAHRSLGGRALAITAVSPSLPASEARAARELARSRGWNHIEMRTHEMERPEYVANDGDRCYWCKTELLEVLGPVALERGAAVALGTNTDDLGDFRPGLRAARENGSIAPLVDAGMSKAEIRGLSARIGLPTADKPAGPCLASRIAYGVRVTPERLRRVDHAETFLRSLGFKELRVRDHGDLARIEVPASEIDNLASHRAEIVTHLSDLGFRYVTVDLEGFRSGSLNETLGTPTIRRSQG